jgi:enamine deaminase RidA (YjgF/YER057c/UK114 family)
LINRWNVGERASEATAYNGIAFFAVVPERPYDESLSTGQQVYQVLKKLDKRLEAIGSSREGLLFVTVVLRDMQDYAQLNEAWDRWLNRDAVPGRACFQANLSSVAMKVELLVHAAVPETRSGSDQRAKQSALLHLADVWHSKEMLGARVAAAEILKDAGDQEVKLFLASHGRSGDWLNIAQPAQFCRRVDAAIQSGLLDLMCARQEFAGLVWWCDKLAAVYGNFAEEKRMVDDLKRLKAALGPNSQTLVP